MSILSNIWNFLIGNSAEKGSVDGSSKHPLDPLVELEERKVAAVKPEAKEAPKPSKRTRKPAAPKANAGAKTTKTKGTGKTNGNVRHQRKDSRAGK